MKSRQYVDIPTNTSQFKVWLKSKLGHNVDDKYKFYYDTVVKQLKNSFEESEFWKKILKEWPEINDKYFAKKGVHLLIPSHTPKIFTKNLESLITKSFRKNVLNNNNFPAPPDSGWVTPDNWIESISDIIRTTITVKYLDGVKFIIDELESISNIYNLDFNSSFEAREEGYYAAHSKVAFPVSMPDREFAPINKIINVEIQVTTQIQEIIKTLLHKHYEEKRQIEIPKDYKWQWDHKCPEFTSNYLGHIIHYVEGMIVEIRDKEK